MEVVIVHSIIGTIHMSIHVHLISKYFLDVCHLSDSIVFNCIVCSDFENTMLRFA